MWGAALRPLRATAVFSLFLAAFAAPSTAAAAPDAGRAQPLPATVWALELDRATAARLAATGLRSYRGQGFNAVVADTRRLSARPAARVRTAAGRAKLLVLAPRAAATLRACTAAKRRGAVPRCAVAATSARAAARLARTAGVDLVVVRLSNLGQLRFLRGMKQGRVLALVPLGSGRLNARAWSAAIASVKSDAALDLGLSLRGKGNAALLRQFGRLLRARDKDVSGGGDDPPVPAPPTPTGLALSVNSTTSVTVSWQAAPADSGVSEYGLHRDGTPIGSVPGTIATFAGLTCNTSYLFEVDSVNVAGGRSGRAALRASTLACGGGGGGGGGGDTTPPTEPPAFRRTGSSTSSIAVAWEAADDNVAVAGYGVYRNGTRLFTPAASARSYTFVALACGTTYTLELDAYDTAGNRSPRASLTTTTNPCVGNDTQPPTAPGSLTRSGATVTSVSVSWTAATDNVGVTGYGLYRDATQTSSAAAGARSFSFSGLACGTSYAFAVDAADAAGNRSTKATLTASTDACGTGDSLAPSVPGNPQVTGSTTTSVSVSWGASTDNVGVSGYGAYRGTTHVASPTGTSHTFTSLACGTGYTFSVDAFDAAGNRSAQASVNGSTAACGPPPPPGSTVHVSTTGSDSNPCSAAAPCKTLDRAWRVAQPGQAIEYGGGSYGGQTLPAVAKSSGEKIVIRPAAGTDVTVSSLSIWGKNAEFQDFEVGGSAYWHCDADNVDFIRGQMGLFFIRSADEIDMVGTEIGPWAADSDSDIGTAEDCREANANLVFDGVWFHDHTSSNPPNGAHKQCLAVTAIDGLTIRNSRFIRCEDFDILFKRYGPVADLKNITLENTWFGDPYPDGTSAIQFSSPDGDDYTNVLIRNNSFGASLTLKPDNRYLNTRVIGNAGTKFGGPCSGLTVHHNVWGDATCSADLEADPRFVNNTSDLHLQADSPAIDRGDPSNYPSHDIDGEARPKGGAPDAGADER